MKLFAYQAKIVGTCTIVVQAATLEEANTKLEAGDFECVFPEWEARPEKDSRGRYLVREGEP